MFCSVIIPTIGRPLLARAVESVLQQQFSDAPFEVIVVNDSGQALPEAAWQTAVSVRILNTERRDRSVARNAGAAVACGDYLCFLDDDDWWLPGALTNFWRARQQAPEASWIYGGVQFVDPAGDHLGFLHLRKAGNCFVEAMSAVWIPLQASLLASGAFFATGGFDPGLSVTEDLDLCRKIALRGEFAFTGATVAAILRGGSWGSSTPPNQVAMASRHGRDQLLERRGSFSRLRESAGASPFWNGRVLHTYVSACLLNLRQRRLLHASGRALYAALSLVRSGQYSLSAGYWRALRTDTLTHTLVTEASPAYNSISDWLY